MRSSGTPGGAAVTAPQRGLGVDQRDQGAAVVGRGQGRGLDGAAAAADLEQDAPIAVPDEARQRAQRSQPPGDLAAEHRHLRLAAGEAGDDLQIEPQRIGQHDGLVVGRAAHARGRHAHRRGGGAQLRDRGDARLGADHQRPGIGRRLAEEAHLREIEAHPLAADDLGIDQAGVEGADHQPVRLGGIEEIGADDVARPRHVADHHLGHGKVPGQVFGDQPGVGVVAAAGAGGDDVGQLDTSTNRRTCVVAAA
jgi:hypothetical protein